MINFREASVGIYLMSVFGLAAAIFSLKWSSKVMLYVSLAIFG